MPRVHPFRAAFGLTIALAAVASVSRAQDSPANGARRPDGAVSQLRLGTMVPQTPITVLMAPGVQKELKLADDQKNKVYELAIASGEKQRDLFQAILFSGGTNPQAILTARDKLRHENEQSISRILDPKQQDRLSQIVLQLEGPLAVSRPEIAEKLRLNDRQREAVMGTMMQLAQGQRQLNMMARRQAVNLNQLDPSQFGQVRAEMAKLRDGAVQQLSTIIDRKQKAAFSKMLGEPFDLSRLDAEGTQATAGPSTKDAAEKSKDEAKADDAPPSGREPTKKPARPARRKARSKAGAAK